MRNIIIAGLVGASLLAGVAQAQPVHARHAYQQERIAEGVRSGRLTPGEAHRLERQQRSIRHEESRRRYYHGGTLTAHDRAVLRHRENRASRHIYRAKHNGRYY